MVKRIEWTPQARADVRRINRQMALSLLEELADYVLNGHGEIKRLQNLSPPEFRLRVGDYRVRFYDHGDRIQILRIRHSREASR
jgi:mRNA-degrading endonuclease RelE of RelBE toxin-antitoxin system